MECPGNPIQWVPQNALWPIVLKKARFVFSGNSSCKPRDPAQDWFKLDRKRPPYTAGYSPVAFGVLLIQCRHLPKSTQRIGLQAIIDIPSNCDPSDPFSAHGLGDVKRSICHAREPFEVRI